jgi:hypothetical protein
MALLSVGPFSSCIDKAYQTGFQIYFKVQNNSNLQKESLTKFSKRTNWVREMLA